MFFDALLIDMHGRALVVAGLSKDETFEVLVYRRFSSCRMSGKTDYVIIIK